MISIIVPVYNSKQYLPRCLESLIKQIYSDIEIIIVNDGSTDGSDIICHQYSLKDQRIRVFHKKNGGQATARNLGLKHANGEYIGFVDSDDWIEPSMYYDLINAIGDHDIAMCGRYNVDESNNKTELFCFSKLKIFNRKESIQNFLLSKYIDGAPCDKLFKKSVLENVLFPSGYICEDLTFVYNALLNSKSIIHIGKPLYNYFQRSGSTSHCAFSKKTYGLIIYPNTIFDDVVKRYPDLTIEATIYKVSRKYYFEKIFFDTVEKGKPEYLIKLPEYKYLRPRDRFCALLMKLNIYRAVKRIIKK